MPTLPEKRASPKYATLATAAAAIAIVAIAAWSLVYVDTVHSLRDGVSVRVGWLIEIRSIESDLLDAERAQDLDTALHRTRLLVGEVRDIAPAVALQLERAAQLLENRRAADDRAVRANEAVLAAFGEAVDSTRVQNAELSEALGERIDRLSWLTAGSLILGVLALGLLGWGYSRERTMRAERARAEALSTSLKFLVEASPAVLYTAPTKEPFDFTFISRNVVSVFGQDPVALMQPGSRTALVFPEDRDTVTEHYCRAARRGQCVTEYRVLGANGQPCWVRDECHRAESPKDLLVGCLIDVTDRREAGDALREALQNMERRVEEAVAEVEVQAGQMRAVVRAATDAVLITGPENRVVSVNPAGQMMFGRSEHELLGGSLDVVSPDLADRLTTGRLDAGLSTGVVHTDDGKSTLIGRRADGRAFPIEVSVGRVPVEDSSDMNVLIVRDVTERERDHSTLAARAQELARSNAELEAFAAAASHDLSEPLRKIQIFGDLLSGQVGTSLDAESTEYLGFMTDAATRLQALIRDLLDYARVGEGAEALTTDVDLEALAREVVRDLPLGGDDPSAKVTIGALPTVVGNRAQLRRVLQNLVANAARYRRPGANATITISAQSSDEWHEVSVADDGIGFDMAYAALIMRPFKRLHSADEFKGTGIGLAICQKIAVRHGGRLEAQSEVGHGATFTLFLPVEGPSGEHA